MRGAVLRYSSGARLSLTAAIALSILFVIAIQTGRAASPITVTTTIDTVKTDGLCSLREAIIAANKDQASSPADCPAGSGTDTIIVPAGTYTLTRTDNGKEDSASTGDLDITSNIIISPTGPVTITAISGFSDRIFQVLTGGLSINNVTIMNGNVTGDGAAIYVGTGAALTLTSSTLANNTASDHGGAIASAGSVTLINDTISGNKVLKTNSANYGGGGLYVLSGTTTIVNVTIANNTANTQTGSGGNVRRVGGTLTLKNTLIANAVSGGNCGDGTFTSAGYNLSSDNTCSNSLSQAGDRNNVNPFIGALLNNGGWTMTHALPLNSPAVDGGTNTGCPATDQRGQSRPIGLACDIGSYENQDPLQHGPIITVNKPGDIDDGACTYLDCKLREAITLANVQPNSGGVLDQIQFNLPPTTTIYLSNTLPTITSSVIITGSSRPTGTITIDGSTATAGSDCFLINGNGSTLINLIIRNCPVAGIRVLGGTGNALRSNSIYNNGALGIDLGTDNVTKNDLGDTDTGPNNYQNFPILLRANSLILGRLNSAPNTTYSLDFFSNTKCDVSNYGEGRTYLGTSSATTDARGNVYFKANFTVPDGLFITSTATDPGGSTSEFSPCIVSGPNNDSWVTALRVNPANSLPVSTDQYLSQEGQARWYKFKVQPGSRVVVKLTNLPANYDLSLYKDISDTFEALNSQALLGSTQGLNQLGAEFAPDAFTPDAFTPDAFTPDAFTPDAFTPDAFTPDAFTPDAFTPDAFTPDAFTPDAFAPDAFTPDAFTPDAFTPDAFTPDAFTPDAFTPDAFTPDAFTSAQTRSLIGVSAFEGIAGEGIAVNTWTQDGDFYVRVRGRNGAFNLQTPFHVEMTVLTGECANVAPITAQVSPPAPAGNYKTIILTDWSRLPGTADDKAMLQTRLATFSGQQEVGGVVVDVGADSRVAAANTQADQYPACPYAKNLLADAIKGIVDRYRHVNPLEYVVIIGGDNVIPFYRSPDQAMLGNELNYSPPVRDNTASQASLKLSYILSQDRYGELLDLSSRGNTFPLPGLAVGRLVETANEATRMLDAYLKTANGVIPTPISSLVTGYDFLADAATAVSTELKSGIGVTPDGLIAPRDLSPQDPRSWTATDLTNKLLGSRHDLIFLAGHFSANTALAADYSTRLTSSAVDASSTDFENAIIYSAGCHSGYNIVDAHNVSGVTREPDWAQTFARKGATLIAGTGYQYGDTDFIEYSERLYVDFTQQLRLGSGPVAVGKALVAAKQQYLADTPVMRPIHEKALLEATLFGLPMLSVNLPGRTTPSSDSSIVPSTTPYTANPGATLGLSYADVNVTPSLTQHTDVLTEVTGPGTPIVNVTATYFSGANGVVSNPTEPILPLETRNVSGPNGLVLRGIGFRSGSYTDLKDILPRTGAATTEIRGVHSAFMSTVFYPIVPWRINYLDALLGGSTQLVATPTQYQSSDPSSITGTLRRYKSLQFRLFYNNNTGTYANNSTPGLAAPPYIVKVTDVVANGLVTVSVSAVGNPAAGIQNVWATYTADSGPYAGQWQSIDLARDANDSTLWQGAFPLNGTDPQAIHYMVQAVNGVGLVTLMTNMGVDYIPGSVTPNRTPTALALTAAAPSGPYGTEAQFSAVLTSDGVPVTNTLVEFGLGSLRSQAKTDSTGLAKVNIPLLSLPNDYIVRASFRGNATYQPASAEASFTIVKQETNLALTPAAASGLPEKSALLVATLTDATGRRLSEKTVFFVVTGSAGSYSVAEITDYAGRAMLGNVPLLHGAYTVKAYFSGPILLSTGETVTLEDDRYLPSSASATLNLENHPPVAVNDTYGVEQNHTLSVSAPGVLSNDTDADNDLLSASPVGSAAHGSLALNADGSFVYTPQTNFSGMDTFTYRTSDGFGGTATATVTINVHATNHPPSCSTAYPNPLTIWSPNGTFYPVVVQGVTDPDSDPLTIVITGGPNGTGSGIWQDEPVSNNGPDGYIGSDHLPYVRAKRAGSGDGRVYHIYFKAIDPLGLTCSGSVRAAVVTHDQSGSLDAIDQGPLYDSTIVGP